VRRARGARSGARVSSLSSFLIHSDKQTRVTLRARVIARRRAAAPGNPGRLKVRALALPRDALHVARQLFCGSLHARAEPPESAANAGGDAARGLRRFRAVSGVGMLHCAPEARAVEFPSAEFRFFSAVEKHSDRNTRKIQKRGSANFRGRTPWAPLSR
jgi:hypothetical protein